MSIDAMIEVLQAAKEGKAIQVRQALSTPTTWRATVPLWDFERNEYRVKPEPRTVWLVEKPDGSLSGRTYVSRDHALGIDTPSKPVKFIEVIE